MPFRTATAPDDLIQAFQPLTRGAEAAAVPTPTLLEDGFPFRELSILTKADRRGRDPSYGVHRWWARRPPALVRGILLAAFTRPSPSLADFWRRFSQAEP